MFNLSSRYPKYIFTNLQLMLSVAARVRTYQLQAHRKIVIALPSLSVESN
jgi:hypothetical protein